MEEVLSKPRLAWKQIRAGYPDQYEYECTKDTRGFVGVTV